MRQPFDSTTVKLTGTNLIEASAGTGKTYSIAIMVLRLVLEEKVSIREILMVTFTKAAVAELEERIRAFMRMAYRASTGQPIDDPTIQQVVSASIDQSCAEDVQLCLQQAVLFLDETAVMTIHGFCQQTLTEFAFETGQVFGAETLQDPAAVLEEQVNKFWRKQVTTMPEPLLAALSDGGLSRQLLIKVISEHLNGKRYLPYQEGTIYDCTGDQHQQWMLELQELRQKEEQLIQLVHSFITSNRERLFSLSETDHNAKKALSHLIDDPQEWLVVIKSKADKKYTQKLFPDILERCSDCDRATGELKLQYRKILSHLYCMAIAEVSKAVAAVKERQNLIAFDDMIAKVHAALNNRSNPRLEAALQSKYKAVFIDEFQDTDKLQYEIFEAAFGSNTTVFYIGDPKQSIYAWRKADLQTYFRARHAVDEVYQMNINFRSTREYIEAMNEFFSVPDPFYFNADKNGIDYIDVEAPANSSKDVLLFHGSVVKPISIIEASNKTQIQSGVVGDVIRLLDNQLYQIQQKDEFRSLKPYDLGILVRTNKEGAQIKNQLARYGIPAVTIGDNKVLQSEEALMVWHLLIAMEEPALGNINRALISPLAGYNADSVLLLKEDLLTDMFRSYRKTWEESGIYTAMMNLIAGLNIRGHLASDNTDHGERSITNLVQLIELLHKVQVRQNFSTLELIAWLKRGIDGMVMEGDEYEQRVESDEESVRIVTIHKSKGLEYNIVLCPYLDQASENSHQTASFRNPETNEYVSVEEASLTGEQKQLIEQQATQEKRRMIYVALTRAVYKCFIYKNAAAKVSSKSQLNCFMNGRDFNGSSYIDRPTLSFPPDRFRYPAGNRVIPSPLVATQFKLQQPNWRKVSYTSLAAKHEFHTKPTVGGIVDIYDRFLFYQLPKGAHTGNMFHYILEQINFTTDVNWSFIIDKAITQFAPNRRELYAPLLRQLLETVMNVPIVINGSNFSLSEVEPASCVHEFEFDFSISGLQPAMMNALSNESMTIALKEQSELEGLMNGLIDLLFYHQGKYYILDWKSNYLGDSMEVYGPDRLAEAMNENNYHLQYLIYTVAARKYLQSRLGPDFNFSRDFGGIIYIFIRGVRKDQPHGIYTSIPSPSLIQQLENNLLEN